MLFPRSFLAAAATLILTGAATAQDILRNPAKGNPNLQSIHALSFGPQGLLLLADGKGQQLVGVLTGDTKRQAWSKTAIPNIRGVLAGALSSRSVDIVKMAVNPASQTAYFLVRADNKKEVLVTLDGAGKASLLSLANLPHVAVKLSPEPKVVRLTDVAWGGDRVLLSGQASDPMGLGSKILSVPTPLAAGAAMSWFNAETYHVSHRRWETMPPISAALPYVENGKPFIIGAYTCTPLVKYPLDKLKSGDKVKGLSVLELGPGNTPLDMFAYEKGGNKYILVNHRRFHHKQNPVGPSPYWATKIDYTILEEDADVNEKALWRTKGKASVSMTGRAQIAEDYHGVIHLDRLDNERALAVWTDDQDKLDLKVLPLP